MPSVFDKLNLKQQKQILVLNSPASFEPELKTLRGVSVQRDLKNTGEIEFSLAFVTKQTEVNSLGKAIAKKAEGDAIIWFAYPKEVRKNTSPKSTGIRDGKFSATQDSNRSEWSRSMRTGRPCASDVWTSLKR